MKLFILFFSLVSFSQNLEEIKKAIEKAFDVKVEKVNTLNTKSKKKRVGRYK